MTESNSVIAPTPTSESPTFYRATAVHGRPAKRLVVTELRGGEVALSIIAPGPLPMTEMIMISRRDMWRLCGSWIRYRAGRMKS